MLLGVCQPVQISENALKKQKYKIIPLLFLGEKSYVKRECFCRDPVCNTAEDSEELPPIVLLSESKQMRGNSYLEGNFVAIGNSSFVNNGHSSFLGNKIFISEIIKGLTERKSYLENLNDLRKRENKQLILALKNLISISFYLLIEIVVVALIGCTVKRYS